jgi:hypothetical protein
MGRALSVPVRQLTPANPMGALRAQTDVSADSHWHGKRRGAQTAATAPRVTAFWRTGYSVPAHSAIPERFFAGPARVGGSHGGDFRR